VVDVIQGQVGVARANCRAGGAGERGVRPLAQVHIVVLGGEGPWPGRAVIQTNTHIPAAGLEVLAAADAARRSRRIVAGGRNEAERRGMLSAGEGPAGPDERQPLIERVAEPWT